MGTFNPGVSVIICCYNSAARLPETLKHLAQQNLPPNILFEVIVVNNASTDNTAAVAENEWQKYQSSGEFRIVDEKKPGLSYARQRGAKEATCGCIVFCDDDNWLAPDYLHNAFRIMESDPQIGALGGRSTAVTDDVKLPDWFEGLQNGFAVGPQAEHEGDVSKTCMLWGAGLVTRKNIFLHCYPDYFPAIMSDRKGDFLSSGGDNEFCYRLLLKGYKLFYDEKLRFIHFISKVRWSDEYAERAALASQKGVQVTKELNKYALLTRLKHEGTIGKSVLLVKTFLGYLSTLILRRKSWALEDVKVILFYYTRINLGVDENTRKIFKFYKEPSGDKSISAKKQHIDQ